MSGNALNLPEGSTQEKDDLTKLYTRYAARERILERLLKNADEQGMLLLIDLDDFCRINQQYGKTYADSVLKQVGSLEARWCLVVSNEPCRKLAGKLLRFCGIRRIKNKKRTFPGERAPRNVLFYF